MPFLKGQNNPRWNGGTSAYPNHSLMKRVRNEVLAEANHTCFFCGRPANQIHHLDLSKDNHSKKNLVACCRSCNQKRAKPYTSKYKRLYGQLGHELAQRLNVSIGTILNWHKNNILKEKLKEALWAR